MNNSSFLLPRGLLKMADIDAAATSTVAAMGETGKAGANGETNLKDKAVNDEGVATEGRPLMSRAYLSEQVDQLVNDINVKRKRDTELIEEIRKHLEAHLSSFMQSLEASILKRHDTTNKEIEPKLQELTEVLQRIEKLEGEMEDYKSSLGSLCKGLEQPLSSEM